MVSGASGQRAAVTHLVLQVLVPVRHRVQLVLELERLVAGDMLHQLCADLLQLALGLAVPAHVLAQFLTGHTTPVSRCQSHRKMASHIIPPTWLHIQQLREKAKLQVV